MLNTSGINLSSRDTLVKMTGDMGDEASRVGCECSDDVRTTNVSSVRERKRFSCAAVNSVRSTPCQ